MQCLTLFPLTNTFPGFIDLLAVLESIASLQANHLTPSPQPIGVCAGVSGKGFTFYSPVSGGGLHSLRPPPLLYLLTTTTILLMHSSISLNQVLLVLTKSSSTSIHLYINLIYYNQQYC
jgi:hypothetical protein